jgi:AraC-like DNA-binding protein
MFDIEQTVLPGCRLFVSSDVDETRHRISQVMQPHTLQPLGRARGTRSCMDFLRLPEMGIGSIRFGHMSVHVDSIADYHLVIFCRRGEGRIKARGGDIVVNAHQGACLAPGEPLIGTFSPDCEQLLFRIDERLIRRSVEAPAPRLAPLLSTSRPELSPWVRTVTMLLGDPRSIDLLRKDHRLAENYQQMFVGTLLAGHEYEGDGGSGAVPACVHRAKAYIREMYEQPIGLSEIAAAAEVPVRTLLHNFRRFCRKSPMCYLREHRLDAARQLLLQPSANKQLVASVAIEVGLNHLGRFSQSYFERFGEHPSETLGNRTYLRRFTPTPRAESQFV